MLMVMDGQILLDRTVRRQVTAVSYTHLDVYKRQILKGLTGKGEKLGIMTAAAEVTVDQLTMGEQIRDNFLMSNFAGLVEVDKSDIYDTDAKAEAAPVKLDVERRCV